MLRIIKKISLIPAICFYIPRYLWKTWEGGRIKMLVLDLNCPVVNDESKEERKKILLDYFSENLNRHNFYAFRFFICEALNFVNVFVQIYFMDYFLDGEFSTYGSDVLSFTEMEPEERADPMSKVFPKVTKCTFHKYGPSGSVQKFDGEHKLSLAFISLSGNLIFCTFSEARKFIMKIIECKLT